MQLWRVLHKLFEGGSVQSSILSLMGLNLLDKIGVFLSQVGLVSNIDKFDPCTTELRPMQPWRVLHVLSNSG